MPRRPRLIPVLDLWQGEVVHGVGGRRDLYQPLQTPLTPGADPRAVARAIRKRYGCRSLYVADLDGIRRRRPNLDVLRSLAAEGFQLAVDVGVRDASDMAPLLDAGVQRVIAALETSPGPAALRELLSSAGKRLIFSLDLHGGRTLVADGSEWEEYEPLEIIHRCVACGVDTLLVLDLAGVGRGQGAPTLPLCRAVRERFPELELWTGGGVRDTADVGLATSAGVDVLLVATALHAGRLDGLFEERQAD